MRSLELKLERLLTTGTFNLIVKDPMSKSALGGRLRIDDTNPAIRAVVLETFQTYYAISRAVNPRTKLGIREHRALNVVTRGGLFHHGGTEITEFLKIEIFSVPSVPPW